MFSGEMVTFTFSFAYLPLFRFFCSRHVSPRLQHLRHQLFPASQERHHLSGIVLSSFSNARLRLYLMVSGTIDCLRNAVPWLSSTAASSWLVLPSLFLCYLFICFIWSALDAQEVQCLPKMANTNQEPLNLSSRHRPRSPLHKANGRMPGKGSASVLLFSFSVCVWWGLG